MRSMNGLAVAARLRALVLGCAIATALALSATVLAATASAVTPAHEGYLAIGDSLAFGYSQQLFNENEKTGENPAAFTHGYVDDYLKTLPAGVALTNDGCPGETTDSMIGNGPLSAQMAALGTTGEAPCAYKYVDKLRLHNEYLGTSSQLENSLERIKIHGQGENPVTTVTLNIGANDQLHQLRKCEAEVKAEFESPEHKSKYGATPEEAQKNCILVHIPGLFEHILKNIAGSLYAIRNGSQFCVPAATTCPGKGEKGENFTGKIVVQGGYNPFGAVVTPGVELLPGSNLLVELLNFREASVVGQFGACYANPQPVFNPFVVGEPGREPGQLQALTNMANTTVFEGKKNGPDIHATPAGYQELSNIMKADCG